MAFEYAFLNALEAMCMGMFAITIPSLTYTWDRLHLSFLRRYKWAFRPEYANYSSPLVVNPDLDQFLSACTAMLDNEEYSPSSSFVRAKEIFVMMCNGPRAGWAGQWHVERMQFVKDLCDLAGQLADVVPKRLAHVPSFDESIFDWDKTKHRWFPGVRILRE